MATPAIPIRKGAPSAILPLFALAGLAVAAGVAAWLLAADLRSGSSSTQAGPPAAAVAAFEQRTGVQVVRVAVTGGGGIVDLRYRVLDVDKAAIVHDPARRPALVDERTGEVIGDPFMGMWMHSRYVKQGVVYYQLLVNRKRLIEPGERVSVRLGGVTLRDVPVE